MSAASNSTHAVNINASHLYYTTNAFDFKSSYKDIIKNVFYRRFHTTSIINHDNSFDSKNNGKAEAFHEIKTQNLEKPNMLNLEVDFFNVKASKKHKVIRSDIFNRYYRYYLVKHESFANYFGSFTFDRNKANKNTVMDIRFVWNHPALLDIRLNTDKSKTYKNKLAKGFFLDAQARSKVSAQKNQYFRSVFA